MWACLLPSRSSCHAAHSAFSQSPSFAVPLSFSDREGRPAHPADLYTPPHTVLHRSTSTRRTTLFDSLLSIFLSFCRVFSPRLFLVAPFVTHTLPFSFVSLARRERMKDRVPQAPRLLLLISQFVERGKLFLIHHFPPSLPPSHRLVHVAFLTPTSLRSPSNRCKSLSSRALFCRCSSVLHALSQTLAG